MKCSSNNEKLRVLTDNLRAEIKTKSPLVVNITNAVTMAFVANGLLCLGASPVMSQAANELAELVQVAGAVVVNVGTLNPAFMRLANEAARCANRFNKPLIVDPVGAGATQYRTETCQRFLAEHQVAVVRGNAGEISALSGAAHSGMRGVDSVLSGDADVTLALQVARRYQTTVVMSGAVDVIAHAEQWQCLMGGSALMPQVTGSGCLLSAVVAAFNAGSAERFEASIAACLSYGLCGEQAAERARAPGSFKVQFLDALYNNHPLEVCDA